MPSPPPRRRKRGGVLLTELGLDPDKRGLRPQRPFFCEKRSLCRCKDGYVSVRLRRFFEKTVSDWALGMRRVGVPYDPRKQHRDTVSRCEARLSLEKMRAGKTLNRFMALQSGRGASRPSGGRCHSLSKVIRSRAGRYRRANASRRALGIFSTVCNFCVRSSAESAFRVLPMSTPF